VRRKKMPYIIRLVRLSLKSVWYALTIPNDPHHEKEVNFWNMPLRKKRKATRPQTGREMASCT
jgi:hypothetical protein